MKKSLIIINCIIISVFCSILSFAELTGDLNNNGRLDISDARIILRYSAKLTYFDEKELNLADIDSNGKINVADARKILRIIAKLDSETEKVTNTANKTELQPTEIYNLASEYTVEIQCFDKNGNSAGNASAFYIDGNGTLATNYHVIENAYSAYIIDYNGNKFSVNNVISYNSIKDLALISTEKKAEKYASFSSDYKTGESVYTLGSPLGLTGTFTAGMISTAEREFKELNNSIKYIQFTAPITHGNSGGPLINKYGEVIGISSLTYVSAQNLNFAIPVYELDKLNRSTPLTMAQFYTVTHSELTTKDTFYGVILPYSNTVTVNKDEVLTTYVVGLATSDYTICAESDTKGFTVKTGEKNGNITTLIISADGTAETGKLKIFFDKNSNISTVITVVCTK